MDPWVKRMLALPVVMLALVCLVAAIGSAQARNPGELGWMNSVPLRGSVTMTVRSIVLHHNGNTYLLETRNGVDARNQNRVPLGRVPLLGPLTNPTFQRPAFADEHQVASVTADGDRLFVDLPAGTELPGRVIIFNQNNAFFLRDRLVPHVGQIPLAGTPVANAYFQEDGRNLLIMVRPSIILDGALF